MRCAKQAKRKAEGIPVFPQLPRSLGHFSVWRKSISQWNINKIPLFKRAQNFFVQITHDEWKGENKNPQMELFNPFLSDAMMKVLPKSHQ